MKNNNNRKDQQLLEWDADLEAWWQEKIKHFPGGISNAIWHMPDAAARRMKWLEARLPNK
jgi:hypothetical protein